MIEAMSRFIYMPGKAKEMQAVNLYSYMNMVISHSNDFICTGH